MHMRREYYLHHLQEREERAEKESLLPAAQPCKCQGHKLGKGPQNCLSVSGSTQVCSQVAFSSHPPTSPTVCPCPPHCSVVCLLHHQEVFPSQERDALFFFSTFLSPTFNPCLFQQRISNSFSSDDIGTRELFFSMLLNRY